MRRAEGALMPTRVDMPAAIAAAIAAAAIPGTAAHTVLADKGCTAAPAAAAGIHSRPTLHETPGVLAAAHTSGAIAEVSSAMALAERLPPSVERGLLQ